MRKLGLRLALLACAVATVAFASACGGDDNEGGGGGGGKTGGSITVGTVGPDSYDPALILTVQAFQPLHTVYTGLLAFKDESGKAGTELIPGLAEKMPTVSSDGKTYEFTLRKGLKYSDGTPVKASDFEFAIKRLLKLAGPFSSFVTTIEGTEEFQKKGDVKADIPGIETDNKAGKVTVKLTTPDSKFQYAMAEPYTALIPESKSKYSNMTKDPPPGLGSYTIKVVDPSREFILTKNKSFNIPRMAKGNLDKITGQISSNVTKMTQDVINGKLDFMTEDPTGDLLPTVKAKYKDRFSLNPYPPNTYYMSMNGSTPPFNNVKAREAVNYALDSRALQRIFGGRLKPTCTFIPPGTIGYKEPDPCPYGDPNGPGDIEKAKQLVKESGTAGSKVTMWTNNKDPRPAIGDYMRDTLTKIGYKADVKTLNQQVYFDAIGTKSRKAQIHFNDWFMDFPDPADLFQPILHGDALESTPTFNTTYTNDSHVNSEVDKLSQERDPASKAAEWTELDHYVVEPGQAFVAPYGSELSSTFMSERMNYQDCNGIHQVFKNNWTQFCLK